MNKEANHAVWRKALEDYLAEEAKGVDYRTFLITSLLREDIAVEQANWILERIGELSVTSCGCNGSCNCGTDSYPGSGDCCCGE